MASTKMRGLPINTYYCSTFSSVLPMAETQKPIESLDEKKRLLPKDSNERVPQSTAGARTSKAWKVRKANHLPESKLVQTNMRKECLVHVGLASPFSFSSMTLHDAALNIRGETAKISMSRRPWPTRNDGPCPKITSTTLYYARPRNIRFTLAIGSHLRAPLL